jgi:hypothetical protein
VGIGCRRMPEEQLTSPGQCAGLIPSSSKLNNTHPSARGRLRSTHRPKSMLADQDGVGRDSSCGVMQGPMPASSYIKLTDSGEGKAFQSLCIGAGSGSSSRASNRSSPGSSAGSPLPTAGPLLYDPIMPTGTKRYIVSLQLVPEPTDPEIAVSNEFFFRIIKCLWEYNSTVLLLPREDLFAIHAGQALPRCRGHSYVKPSVKGPISLGTPGLIISETMSHLIGHIDSRTR